MTVGDNLLTMPAPERGPWLAVATLVDPSRRAIYEYVRAQGRPVTRDDAASSLSISHNLAAFHLDKLVDAGLLRAGYEVPPSQPRGRGRTPKVYEAAEGGVALTIPERRYDLMAEILANAVVDDRPDARAAALRIARERGEQIGRLQRQDDERPGLHAVLAQLGFEPHSEPSGGRTTLRNCPFHALVGRQPALVCGLNLAFVSGLLAGLGVEGAEPVLDPRPGACCVEVRTARS
ncbi:helix-turn-helix transcriptional regulator [Actinopolymorpha alba]|uniref:helix-turn-helix transcriptional regulator n=1 Tax=Actinopolymorpha alba TaxID=533267 RepID=UPI00036CA985|nr:helix-turn-helix domain-containing protein [Actinopolymorpha alba]